MWQGGGKTRLFVECENGDVSMLLSSTSHSGKTSFPSKSGLSSLKCLALRAKALVEAAGNACGQPGHQVKMNGDKDSCLIIFQLQK